MPAYCFIRSRAGGTLTDTGAGGEPPSLLRESDRFQTVDLAHKMLAANQVAGFADHYEGNPV